MSNKSVQDFKEIITTEFMAMPAVKSLYKLRGNEEFNTRFPPASIEGVLMHLWAFGAWVMYNLFNTFQSEVDARITEMKPHSLQWYVGKAKQYQHGVALPTFSGQIITDRYATVNEKKQIVKYAVAQEVTIMREGQEVGSVVSMKVAKHTSNSNATPAKLTHDELQGLKYYFSQIKDAGVPISLISNDPDTMRIAMSIYYNPIMLEPTSDNSYLVDDSGTNVISNAVLATIEALPFNGVLKKSEIIDAVNSIAGIEVVDITAMSIRPEIEGAEYTPVTGYCTPASGYFAIDQLNLTLNPYNNDVN